MSVTPTISLVTVSNLSDVLREMPLVTPTDYSFEDDQPNNQKTSVKLFDNQQQFEAASQLLNSTDPFLIDFLSRTLSQIDTSKIIIKPISETKKNNKFYLPPILQKTLFHNPKLFNDSLHEQYNQLQPINYQQTSSSSSIQSNYPSTSSQSLQPQSFYNSNNNTRQPINNYNIETQQSQVKVSSNQISNEFKATPEINQNNIDVKLSTTKIQTNNNEKDKTEHVATSKFYSKSESSIVKPEQTKDILASSKESDAVNKAKKKQEKTKNQLSTWQANLTSQLLLPADFTPELISQLTAEGYDVVSGANRKARSRQQSTLVNSINSIVDSSDEDDKNDDVYSSSKSSKNKTEDNQSIFRPVTKLRTENNKSNPKIDSQDANDNPSFKRFSQMLEDLIDSYEQDIQQINRNKIKKNDSDDQEDSDIPPEYLLARQLCSDLVQEAFKLNSYSIMNLIRKETLVKLQNLIYFNIKDGLRSLNFSEESNNSEQDKLLREILIDKLLRASDCSILSLIIMTSEKISKELIVEDIIEQIAIFVKVHLTETIFPYYDSVYKTFSNTNIDSKSNTKRKLINQFTSSVSSHGSSNSNKAKNIQHFYNRMREILNLIGELICQIDMTDTIIITLSSLSVMCFFVENINDLQLEALKILTNIFTRYSKHRQLVLDDILASLVKLHPNKRNSRLYKCFNGDSIQMFSALILQLIQCEVTTTDQANFQNNNDSNILMNNMELEAINQKSELTFEEKESFLINSLEESSQTAKKFLSVFFSKCKTKQADSDFRPVFENFIQDLLITVNKPEWPVSEIILNLLGIILVNVIQSEQNDVSSRVNSLEYLGQIVSQLRKDSLEYQKYPEKVSQVLNKINVDSQKDEELFNLQKCLISYLDSLIGNDYSLQYSKYFLVGQWLKELNINNESNNNNKNNNDTLDHGQERMNKQITAEENRKRLYNLIDKNNENNKKIQDSNNKKFSNIQLDMNEAFILSKYLCSLKKTQTTTFDKYLLNILSLSGGTSESNIPTQVRSKAIKCLSLIIEADPQILLKQKVFQCVEANFMHQTISVREASVDLIGRFITLKPELTNHYYKLLSARILDVGVSVRKRVIKIFRDVCLNQPEFEYLSDICCKILRRINDEDAIKKLVIDTFYSIWFTSVNNSSSNEQLVKRVLNIVDVVSELNPSANNAQSTEIFELLFNSLIVNPTNNSTGIGNSNNSIMNTLNIKDENNSINNTNSNSGNQQTSEQEMQLMKGREVIKSCKQIVDCLIKTVLTTEAHVNSPEAYKRLVGSFSTLYLLSKIKPDNFINHAETLLPYLNIKSTNQNDIQIINSAARILECVIPLLQSPSNSFLISLEESLCKLIFQGGMMIVSSCISCLGTVVNKLTKNYKLAADCFSKFYNNGAFLKKISLKGKPVEQNAKPMLFRVLFTLGLLSKHFDIESEELLEYKVCTKQDLFSMFIHFIHGFQEDVQLKALIGLGSFLTRYNEYMMKDEIKSLYQNYIKNSNVPFTLKSQVFLNLTDYLNEEDQRNLAKSVELSKNHCKDDLKEMLDVQSGMASTIIQSYLKPILDSYLTENTQLRVNVFNCLSMILNQGLVYPIECVPYLIAMTTDNEKKIQSKSLLHLVNLQKAHPGFVQSKSIAGINISFILQKIIIKSTPPPSTPPTTDVNNQSENPKTNESTTPQPLPPSQSPTDSVIRGFSEQGEVLSLNHHLYSLLRVNRSYRRAFLQQLVKMFDDSTLQHTSLAHKLYICDNLAYFPYQLYDEPLYLIHQIDIVISITGINLLQTFKENLLNHQTDTNQNKNDKSNINDLAIENQLIDIDLNQDCPDVDDLQSESAKTNYQAAMSSQLSIKKKSIDEEDETFETVYNNLPDDLKYLKDCMHKAQGCCLLLILKLFLKEIYSISESKIQNYSPSDTAKVNERPITNRKTNRKFNPKKIIDYMKKIETKKEDDNEVRRSLVDEYLEFKELMLSIDNEETTNSEENKNNTNNQKAFANEIAKLPTAQQKLLEGIEKTKPTSGQTDAISGTPRKSVKNRNKHVNSSTKKSGSKKSKKRKRESDCSSDESETEVNNSDFDDES